MWDKRKTDLHNKAVKIKDYNAMCNEQTVQRSADKFIKNCLTGNLQKITSQFTRFLLQTSKVFIQFSNQEHVFNIEKI